jgi:hypothetical protein
MSMADFDGKNLSEFQWNRSRPAKGRENSALLRRRQKPRIGLIEAAASPSSGKQF